MRGVPVKRTRKATSGVIQWETARTNRVVPGRFEGYALCMIKDVELNRFAVGQSRRFGVPPGLAHREAV